MTRILPPHCDLLSAALEESTLEREQSQGIDYSALKGGRVCCLPFTGHNSVIVLAAHIFPPRTTNLISLVWRMSP